MPLFNGNILQLHALLIAAYAGVAKGIANNGKKPDVCDTHPHKYNLWYSMHSDDRSPEHNTLYNEWKTRVLARLHAKHGSPDNVGAAAAQAMPDGTSAQNRARARAEARAKHVEVIESLFGEEEEREKAARSALMGELSERTEPAKFSKYLSKLHARDANDGVVLVSKIADAEAPSSSATAYAEHTQRLAKITYGTRTAGGLVEALDDHFYVMESVAGNGQELCTHEDALTQVAHCGPCRFGQSEILFSTACHGQFRTDPYAYSSYHVGN